MGLFLFLRCGTRGLGEVKSVAEQGCEPSQCTTSAPIWRCTAGLVAGPWRCLCPAHRVNVPRILGESSGHCERAAKLLGQDFQAVAPCSLPTVSPHPPSHSAMVNVGQKGCECQTPLPILESQAGQHVPGETTLPPHTSARTHAHPSGVTAALPPSVPCVSLTGQCSGVVNHEQIGHSQREAKGTQGGDTAIKAISTELARQTKAQLAD